MPTKCCFGKFTRAQVLPFTICKWLPFLIWLKTSSFGATQHVTSYNVCFVQFSLHILCQCGAYFPLILSNVNCAKIKASGIEWINIRVACSDFDQTTKNSIRFDCFRYSNICPCMCQPWAGERIPHITFSLWISGKIGKRLKMKFTVYLRECEMVVGSIQRFRDNHQSCDFPNGSLNI